MVAHYRRSNIYTRWCCSACVACNAQQEKIYQNGQRSWFKKCSRAKCGRSSLMMQVSNNINKPLVYSCSGCSSAAQMANYFAVQLDRSGIAEMSCIAGVGGNVKKLVKTALS